MAMGRPPRPGCRHDNRQEADGEYGHSPRRTESLKVLHALPPGSDHRKRCAVGPDLKNRPLSSASPASNAEYLAAVQGNRRRPTQLQNCHRRDRNRRLSACVPTRWRLYLKGRAMEFRTRSREQVLVDLKEKLEGLKEKLEGLPTGHPDAPPLSREDCQSQQSLPIRKALEPFRGSVTPEPLPYLSFCNTAPVLQRSGIYSFGPAADGAP